MSGAVVRGRGGRIEGPDKVTGRARYAYEHSPDHVAYVWPVGSTIAKGAVTAVQPDAAAALPGVLAVITPDNAPRLHPTDDGELALFQSHAVAYRGQFVAAVVATTLEVAQDAASRVQIDYAPAAHDVTLRVDHPGLYAPDHVNPRYVTDTAIGDFDAGFAAAEVKIDHTYRTPGEHNNPMEPHATLAWWEGDVLNLVDSNQGPAMTTGLVATLFGIDASGVHIVTHHVGGAFGSKGTPAPTWCSRRWPPGCSGARSSVR